MSSPIWHPFTQHALQPHMTPIARAEGAHLFTDEGRRIIDAISSWWVVTHGHCHPHLIEAAHQQAGKLDQVIFAGHTHEPAEKLAAALVEMTPQGLDKVFFSDSGSTAVEVALKMALGYWHHLGEGKRNRIIVMEHSYHGDTVGTMSVGERGTFNKPYASLLFDVDTIPFPKPGHEHDTVAALERILIDHPNQIAALIVEPLVLGAGGMLMYSAEVLRDLKQLCERDDVVFIADEVMTGWGRTGTLFACEQAGIAPDILCTSKGLTGGFLPLAATLCQTRFYDAHFSEDRSKMFFHSSSYTANPIACAVGFANTELWRAEPVQERVDTLAAHQAAHLQNLKGHSGFENLRQCGTISALDVKVSDQGYLSNIAPKLYQHFQGLGVLLRPLGNTIYVLPPYCISADDLNAVYDAIADAPNVLKL
ncbi:adenosylmethionine--8-amino-7-oxononanoate transaminase [Magnetovibrio blakemorei]|uniref:Adenosylmethionine-8-amino-7-oxononanoate aminotransferase n=1 Tax=Magnetovibrio blakemorei TaxID=28181 RepID=A0A1E5Q574_9PROT|nr:adenosylmethionine--8-amino-7-oxononanoate transaminase [Magnetovibrio blakemorei]OEJ65351.1 adenosylmethionine--8-amino-7-oxononanoate transaminase [Magnetovibrio blakemorei]